MTAFTQVIEITADTPDAVWDHVAAWHDQQAGSAPGYVGARVLEDRDRPGTYLIEVDFTSQEEAKRNSARPESSAWAERLATIARSGPEYRNLDQICTTRRR
jgi:quinol monooxygenase YgiN